MPGLPVRAGANGEEPPILRQRVAAGELPAMAARVPATPKVETLALPWQSPGRYGGDLRLLMGKQGDLSQITVYGYGRLVGYSPDLELQPDIAQAVEVEAERIFTIRLRRGHRWSDGHPFTSEDFRYWWEDVANHPELFPAGPPQKLRVDGELPQVSFPDDRTVVYAWSKPNPTFLHDLAGALPLYLYRPSHYMKQFHADYAPKHKLQARVAKYNQRDWGDLHTHLDNLYDHDNPDLPTLQPWVNTTRPPSQRFIFTRNPFYHRVDPQGRQLPYIDRLVVKIAAPGIIPAKTGAGESDLQARYLRFDNYTFLQAAEDRFPLEVRLWKPAYGSKHALYPNLNANDDVWRALIRDVRFRRALSLAIHRHELNQVIYYGLALEGNNTILPRSPLYKAYYRDVWADFSIARANRLLDAIGLTDRDDRGYRLLPDGRRCEIVIESAGDSTEESDLLQLITDSWKKVGIGLHTNATQRSVFRRRTFAGSSVMGIWKGLENGVPTADMSPSELAPVDQYSYQWSKWGQYYQTGGRSGEPVDMAAPKRLLELYEEWYVTRESDRRRAIWHEMLRINAEQQYTLGLVADVPQPVVVHTRLRGVPQEGLYNWDPGSFFGIYRPDTFWWAEDHAAADAGDENAYARTRTQPG
ncbi:peptide ABC transporter substrate-binding protein [Rhodovibrio salinarum]|uniref:Peptide ABC transporter substrate-binding protein n=2 Tax=Rhodovibrio salinarum TaxID=1087 RepID=A0A934UZS9_9PROT|nr:peptide ABC transporter substrate-binding protein [Rhodovibrio salinarum]